ncbi:uncharacterized protein BKA78DRAFT_298018 [Phyllosticta capitalensis]|uniref:uncharacterized protein n=1 Tax=Phyllosticta capitalensis TaxID=121624 RepID=UPI00313156B3
MGSRPPVRAYHFFRRYADDNNREALSVWIDHHQPSLPPLFSFQVYITYDVSSAEDADLEALAKKLYAGLLCEWGHYAKRLDVHFMRPGASPTDCMERHRALVQAEPNNLADVVIPSYVTESCKYHSIVIIVDSPGWKEEGMTIVAFDCSKPNAKFPLQHFKKSLNDTEVMLEDLCSMLKWIEEYEDMYKKAQELGMAEW